MMNQNENRSVQQTPPQLNLPQLPQPYPQQYLHPTTWIPARVIGFGGRAVGISIDLAHFPRNLFQYKHLVGTVAAGNFVWQQSFTLLKMDEKKHRTVHLLARSPGANILKTLRKQGVKFVFVANLAPAE